MVDAINNNRDAVYTGIGAGVGAVAGAGYGAWLSKPLLKDDAPSDAFVRRFYDNDVKNAAETAKKEVQELYTNITETKNLKTEAIAKKLGLAVVEGKENETDIAQKYKWDDVFTDADDLDTARGKIDKVIAENATKGQKSGKELTKLKNAFEKVKEGLDDTKAQEFAKKHAEILGLSADDAASVKAEDLPGKVNKALEGLTGKADELKDLIKDKKLDLTNASDAIKKAAKDTKLWAGAKWAAIGAAVIGVCSYIGAKMTAPKAPAETPSENA